MQPEDVSKLQWKRRVIYHCSRIPPVRHQISQSAL